MLSKFGEENMKNDLETGRRAKSAELEERLKRYMELMDKKVKQEDVTCDAKLFFKTYSSFHLVTRVMVSRRRVRIPYIIKTWYVSTRR